MYSVAILLVRKLSVWGHNKKRTALSREFAHKENRHGVHRHTLVPEVFGDYPLP